MLSDLDFFAVIVGLVSCLDRCLVNPIVLFVTSDDLTSVKVINIHIEGYKQLDTQHN